MFNGWACAVASNVSVLSLFPPMCPLGFEKVRLAFSELLKYVVSLYCKNSTNVAPIIADNFSVDRCLAGAIEHGFIRCVCPRYNLAVMDTVEEHCELGNRIKSIMIFFVHPVRRAS